MHPNGVAISVLKDVCARQEGFTRDWQKTSLCLQGKDVKIRKVIVCGAWYVLPKKISTGSFTDGMYEQR
jgi:hypothetical protein